MSASRSLIVVGRMPERIWSQARSAASRRCLVLWDIGGSSQVTTTGANRFSGGRRPATGASANELPQSESAWLDDVGVGPEAGCPPELGHRDAVVPGQGAQHRGVGRQFGLGESGYDAPRGGQD